MADIGHLGNLAVAEPLDLPQYKDAQEFRLPKKGRYIVRAPESFGQDAFGATKAGYLSAQVDPVIVGPTNEGFTCRFTKVSSKTWTDQKTGQTLSQMGKYLKACGVNTLVSGEPQDLANAVESTAGATYQIIGDWRAYNKNTGLEVEGMENFPTDGKGGFLTYVEDPGELNEEGDPIRVPARFFVSRFLAAS